MSTHVLAVLDDLPDSFDTTKHLIERLLTPEGWRISPVPLEPTADAVASWIVREGVSVLIVDQRLDDRPGPNGHVAYFGHDVVNAVRPRCPELPIYLLTAIPTSDSNITATFGKLEAVFEREKFNGHPEPYVSIMLRAATAFHKRNNETLATLTELSEASARGDLTQAQKTKLHSIQAQMQIEAPRDQQAASEAYVAAVAKLRTLQERIDRHLKSHKGRKTKR